MGPHFHSRTRPSFGRLGLTATVELVIDEAFSREYDQILDRARAEVRDPGE